MATLTPLMKLDLPVVGRNGTAGPDWASKLNTALTAVDKHDHTANKGARITPAALNVNADLDFGSHNGTGFRSVRMDSQSANLALTSDKNALSVVNGDLVYMNGSGVAVKLTSGSGINLSTLGTIGGDFSTSNASVTYSDTTKLFLFKQNSTQTADIAGGSLYIYENVAAAKYTKLQNPASLGTDQTITLFSALPGSTLPVHLSATGVLSAVQIATASLADAAVTTLKLADENVTTSKLNDQSVSTAKIADGAVNDTKLASSSVTTDKVADSNITNAKLALNSVTAGKIAGGEVNFFHFGGTATGAVTAGAFTPSGSASSNISSVTFQSCLYIQMGPIVSVSGRVDIQPSAANTNTVLYITLPVVSDLTQSTQLAGVGARVGVSGSNVSAYIEGDPIGNRAVMSFNSADTSLRAYTYTFHYRVLA